MKGIPQPLLEDIVEGKCLPFVGAGFSLNADVGDREKLPDWRTLATSLATVAGVSSDQSEPDIASAYERLFGRVELIEAIRRLLRHDSVGPGQAHKAFANLLFDTVYTTNFDLLLEQACVQVGRPHRSLVGELQLPFHGGRWVANIIKMHGDLNHEEHVVVTREDYNGFLEAYPAVATHLSAMLITRTPLFLGYSLEDPDFAQIQKIVRQRLGKFERMSYVVQFDRSQEEVERKLDSHVHVINIELRRGETRDLALASLFRRIQKEWDARTGERQRREMPTMFEEIPAGKVMEASRSEDASVLLSSSSNLCFVVMEHTEVGGRVFLELVEPTVRRMGLEAMRPEQVATRDSPMEEIRSAIKQCRLCIVVYSVRSRYVQYEMVLAQSLGKPVVVLVAEGQDLPPVAQGVETVVYDSNPEGVHRAREDLAKTIELRLGKGRLNEGRELIESGSVRAGVAVLGMLLEHTLRRLLADADLADVNRDQQGWRGVSMGRSLTILAKSGAVRGADLERLREAIRIRNRAVHDLREPTVEEALRVYDIVAGFLQNLPYGE